MSELRASKGALKHRGVQENRSLNHGEHSLGGLPERSKKVDGTSDSLIGTDSEYSDTLQATTECG